MMQSFGAMAQTPQLPAKFSTGELRYDCRFSCTFSLVAGIPQINDFYRRKEWEKLAIKINAIGLDTSYSYYGLARAAAGLGFEDAARTYWELAKSTKPYMIPSGREPWGCPSERGRLLLDFCKEMQLLLADSDSSITKSFSDTTQLKDVIGENNSQNPQTDRAFCKKYTENELQLCLMSNAQDCEKGGAIKGVCFGTTTVQIGKFVGEFLNGKLSGTGVLYDNKNSRKVISNFKNSTYYGWTETQYTVPRTFTRMGYVWAGRDVGIFYVTVSTADSGYIEDYSDGRYLSASCMNGKITKAVSGDNILNAKEIPTNSIDIEKYPCDVTKFKEKYQNVAFNDGNKIICTQLLNQVEKNGASEFSAKGFNWKLGSLDALETIYKNGAKISWWDAQLGKEVSTDIPGLKRPTVGILKSHNNEVEWRRWYYNAYGINQIDWTIGGLPIMLFRTDPPIYLGDEIIKYKTNDKLPFFDALDGEASVPKYNFDGSCPSFILGYPTPEEIESAVSVYTTQYGKPDLKTFKSLHQDKQLDNFVAEWTLNDGTLIRLTKYISLMPKEQWRGGFDAANCLAYNAKYLGPNGLIQSERRSIIAGYGSLEKADARTKKNLREMEWENATKNPCTLQDHPRKFMLGEVIFISPAVVNKYVRLWKDFKKNDF